MTPNRVEWQRLQAQLDLAPDQQDGRVVSKLLNGALIVRKGPVDSVSSPLESVTVDEPGSLKRCGGQGDILAGTIAVFSSWSQGPRIASIAAACTVVRHAARRAWEQHHRSMIATDVLQEVGHTMHILHPPVMEEEEERGRESL